MYRRFTHDPPLAVVREGADRLTGARAEEPYRPCVFLGHGRLDRMSEACAEGEGEEQTE